MTRISIVVFILGVLAGCGSSAGTSPGSAAHRPITSPDTPSQAVKTPARHAKNAPRIPSPVTAGRRLVMQADGPELLAWLSAYRHHRHVDTHWEVVRQSSASWDVLVRVTVGQTHKLGRWRAFLPLDRAPTATELQRANRLGVVVPRNHMAHLWSSLPTVPVTSSIPVDRPVELVERMFGLSKDRKKLSVSVVPSFAVDSSLVSRSGVDQALIRGLSLIRGKSVPPFSWQRISGRLRVIEERRRGGKLVSSQHVPLGDVRTFVRSRIGQPLIMRWQSVRKPSLTDLLNTPVTLIVMQSA